VGVLIVIVGYHFLPRVLFYKLIKPSSNSKVVEWLNEQPSDMLFLCAITIGEVRKGLTKLPDSDKKEMLTVWLNTLLQEYKERILSIDLMVCEN